MDDNFKQVGYQEFATALIEAKGSLDPSSAWRVSAYDAHHYEEVNAQCYVSKMGSTVAIAMNGDIISVCRHANDSVNRGKDLINFAKQHGGFKLDCYAGLEKFYKKLGFEIVERWQWNQEYAPLDWRKEFGEEDVLFFELQKNNPQSNNTQSDVNEMFRQLENCNSLKQCEDICCKIIESCCECQNIDEMFMMVERMELILEQKGIPTDQISLPENLYDRLLAQQKEFALETEVQWER